MALSNTDLGYENIARLMKDVTQVYLIGIGGVSMSCLAEMCRQKGYQVYGSDKTPSGITHDLETKGITVFYGHNKKRVKGMGVVIYTLAIDAQNPEYVAAQELHIPCISRADFLGYLMYDYRVRIGVSGMHGKSTTTAMLASVFQAANAHPTVVSGAALSHQEGCYRAGLNEYFLYEACEYMGSFLHFYPTTFIILNMEMDHPDYFQSFQDVYDTFAAAVQKLPSDGFAVLCADDRNVLDLHKSTDAHIITFGISESADFRALSPVAHHGCFCFDLIAFGEKVANITLSVPGMHNVLNALAVAAAAHYAGISYEDIAKGLHEFQGARRRMEYHTTLNGIDIYEDYAHHPTEIKASLSSASMLCSGEVWCVFQSHTYSRTAELFDDFVTTLSEADHVVMLPIYAAREPNQYGVSGEALANALHTDSCFQPDFKSAATFALNHAKEGDLIVVMGAGDVFHVLEEMGVHTKN